MFGLNVNVRVADVGLTNNLRVHDHVASSLSHGPFQGA